MTLPVEEPVIVTPEVVGPDNLYHKSLPMLTIDARIQEVATHPSAEPPVTEFAGQLFFRLWRASHVRAADVLASVGLTPALFGLLNVIGAREGAIQQELGSAMGIDRSTMVSLIDQLESAGLAKRRPSATDRRARQIAITPKGRRLLQRSRRMISETEDEVLAGLTGEERSELVRLLRRALDSAPMQPLWSAEEGD
jgi:MarR family transcriptional regulator, transcriptional regulator for hemolysin